MTDIYSAPQMPFISRLPTPVYKLETLSAVTGHPIFIKRDDMNGPPNEDSGNKTRKLRFLAGEALAQGADTLVTEGGLQSNHCRQTAAVAKKIGLKCDIVYGCERPATLDGNALIVAAMGATIHFAGATPRAQKRAEIVEARRVAGAKPYDFCAGGSTSTGALGYVFFMQELVAQQKETGIEFNHLFHCSSSGGTEAGLVIGREVFGWKGTLHSVVNDPVANGMHHRDYARVLRKEIMSRFDLNLAPRNEVYDLSHEGYGQTTPEDIDAIRAFLKHEGIYIDPVYGAKPARRLLEMLRSGAIPAQDNILLLHTGGHPTMQHERYRPIYSELNAW